MKRSKIFAAALIIAMLSSVFSPFSLSASAGPVVRPSDAELVFEAPEVVQVIIDYNLPTNWPGAALAPRPFSNHPHFWAPLGTPGVDHVLSGSGSTPHMPVDDFEGRGWVRYGTQLGNIRTGAWGEAWGPWYNSVTGEVRDPFVHFPPNTSRMPGRLPSVGAFEFDYWATTPGGGTRVDGRTPMTALRTTLYAQWTLRREVRIRHRFYDNNDNRLPGPGITFLHDIEELPDGHRFKRENQPLNLGTSTTNLHLQFIGFDFYIFMHWSLAVGRHNNWQTPTDVFGVGSTFDPALLDQVVLIPPPAVVDCLEAGRLYFVANWRVIPPGTGQWVPPTRPEGGGGGGGAGAGQQTSPPAGGGVIGGGVGVGQRPGQIPPGGWEDGDFYPYDGPPHYTAVPGTGGAPLIPIVTTFPAVAPPSSVAPLPSPFTPTPPAEAVVLEIPAIAVPIVGFDSNTWALMNLILAIIGALGAVWAIVHVWRKNRNRQESGVDLEAAEESRKRRKQWLFAVGLVSIVSAVLFPLTQDMSNRMTLLDVWTIAHLILLAAQVVATWQILARKKKYDDSDGGDLDTAQANA